MPDGIAVVDALPVYSSLKDISVFRPIMLKKLFLVVSYEKGT